MESVSAFHEFREIERSLEPYIKKRSEVANLRRDLTSRQSGRPPLSLADQRDIGSGSQTTFVLHQEYLRALQQNKKAKEDFASSLKSNYQRSSQLNDVDTESPRRKMLGLLDARRASQRLTIIRGYIDTLSQETLAHKSQINLNISSDISHSPPSIPPEILDFAGSKTLHLDELDDLVDKLEKTVLRAKMLLKREQRLLLDFQSGTSRSMEDTQRGLRINALAATRNELINWIEKELSHGGEDGEDSLNEGDDTQLRIGFERSLYAVHIIKM
jgi:hypothetical protein